MNKYLSKKFIMSVTILAIFLAMAAKSIIQPDMLLWAIMATVLSYVIAKTTEKKAEVDCKSLGIAVSFWQRIKGLFGRDFLLSYVTVWGLSILLYTGYIPQLYASTWFICVTTIAGVYNIGNSISKL